MATTTMWRRALSLTKGLAFGWGPGWRSCRLGERGGVDVTFFANDGGESIETQVQWTAPFLPAKGERACVESDERVIMGVVGSARWRVSRFGTAFVEIELTPLTRRPSEEAESRVSPSWSEQRVEATRHRVDIAGRVGWVYEYANGRCWARVEAPDKKLGSFPNLDEAMGAVEEELRHG